MRLDQAGTATTFDELCARYTDRPWRYMFDEFPEAEWRDAAATGMIRHIAGGLRVDEPIETGYGPYIVVGGSADIARVCVGQHGDRNGVFHVYGGQLSVPLLAVDLNSTFDAKGFRGLLLARGRVEGREPDLMEVADKERLFPAELLDKYGGLDLSKVIAAARAGRPLLLRGVAESFPDRLRIRAKG
jgi:hypothetical protein